MADPQGVGVIGLGAMGRPMAMRLAERGMLVSAYDVDPDLTTRFAAAAGIAPASSPGDVARAAGIVITMLPTSEIVRTVLLGAEGARQHLDSSSLVVEMSSGDPLVTRQLAETLAADDIALIDAPVSGGVARAEQGDLAIMVGGDGAGLERARPALEVLGTTITPTGPVGSGHAMKALNNLVSAGAMAATFEAIDIGGRFGLDPHMMIAVLNASSGMTNTSLRKAEQFVLNERFDSGFGLDLLVKDIGIALGLADDARRPSELSRATRATWERAQSSLGRGRDHTELARYIGGLTGSARGSE